MIFSHVRRIVRLVGTVSDEFFLSIARPIKNHRNFMRQFPALGVCSVLTAQLLNYKKIAVFFVVINIFKGSEVRKVVRDFAEM